MSHGGCTGVHPYNSLRHHFRRPRRSATKATAPHIPRALRINVASGEEATLAEVVCDYGAWGCHLSMSEPSGGRCGEDRINVASGKEADLLVTRYTAAKGGGVP